MFDHVQNRRQRFVGRRRSQVQPADRAGREERGGPTGGQSAIPTAAANGSARCATAAARPGSVAFRATAPRPAPSIGSGVRAAHRASPGARTASCAKVDRSWVSACRVAASWSRSISSWARNSASTAGSAAGKPSAGAGRSAPARAASSSRWRASLRAQVSQLLCNGSLFGGRLAAALTGGRRTLGDKPLQSFVHGAQLPQLAGRRFARLQSGVVRRGGHTNRLTASGNDLFPRAVPTAPARKGSGRQLDQRAAGADPRPGKR